jgi:hypothetical protein
MSRKGWPLSVDSMKQTVFREKRGGREAPLAPGSGSGRHGGHPSQPPGAIDPGQGRAPFTEPGLVGTGKRSKRARGY